jgi:hypothetical protein
MYVFVEPVSEEQITEIQTTNQARVEAFEREIFRLGVEDKTEPSDELGETVEESESEWEQIQAKVEQELQEDANSSGVLMQSEEPTTGANVASWLEHEKQVASPRRDDVMCVIEEGKPGNLGEESQEKDHGDARVERCGGAANGEGQVACVKIGEAERMALNETEDGNIGPGFRKPDGQTSDQTEATITTVQEEKPLGKVEDSTDEADSEWLKQVEEQQQELVPQSEDRDLLAMTLSIRNNVDGRYVLRPENLTKRNSWKVEYSLAEITSATRAWSLYGACQTRRKKALDSGDGKDEDVATNYYLGLMRSLSKAGRVWRKKQDKIDTESGRDKIVLDQSTPKTTTTSSSSSSSSPPPPPGECR